MIDVRTALPVPEIDSKKLRATTKKLLGAAGRGGGDLAILLTDDDQLRELNRVHRGKDKSTDVLSFPGEGSSLGDIAISVETARRQAAAYDAPLENEIHRLLIHGILHVLGHDHHEPAERAAMEAEEKRLAAVIAMPWPYD